MKLKFTIQHMLWATLAFGFVAVAMSAAYRGNIVATGIVIAPLVMGITFAVLAAVYWPCYLVSRLLYPPIHTSAPADFSISQPRHENNSANSPDVNPNPPIDEDGTAGVPE